MISWSTVESERIPGIWYNGGYNYHIVARDFVIFLKNKLWQEIGDSKVFYPGDRAFYINLVISLLHGDNYIMCYVSYLYLESGRHNQKLKYKWL